MAKREVSDLDQALDEMQAAIIQDARENFSEEVVNRWLHPKNIGRMENPHGVGRITGPCGDTMEIFLEIKDNTITNAMFITDGCGTTIAAGSMVTELAIGRHITEAYKISQDVILDALGGLPDDSIHCALLASNTLKEAIRDYFTYKKDPWKKSYRK